MKKSKLAKIDGTCALLALCYAASIEEDTALRLCHMYSFKESRGMFDDEWQGAATVLGLILKTKRIKQMYLNKMLSSLKDGLYILATHNHVFIVDGGVIFDPLWGSKGLRRKILKVWKVTKDAKA